MKVGVIGAGLAGCECAFVLAEKYGIFVTLFEMKKIQMTPAQVSQDLCAELVCSNSLKSKSTLNPAGILKLEMEQLGSLVLESAKRFEVPAGEALAVDREKFSGFITDKIKNHPKIQFVDKIVTNLENLFLEEGFEKIVVATGPLTHDDLMTTLQNKFNAKDLYFYDAIAPILDGDSIDQSKLFFANRQTKTAAYEARNAIVQNSNSDESKKQENISPTCEKPDTPSGDYLNIPLNKEEYFAFVEKLKSGPKVPFHDFEEPRFFNGCMPIEVLAERGDRTLSFGPMKPRGLTDPKTGRYPYAAIQLRKEAQGDSAWNMVGFQTRLTWGAQKEIFRTLPGLEQAEFFRMGSMHRNTYFVSPEVLNPNFSLKCDPRVYLAGQIMGVEGYLESSAMGVWIAHVIGEDLQFQKNIPLPPANTSLGALAHYCLMTDKKNFTPMNIHHGLFTELTKEDIVEFSNDSEKLLKMKKLDKSLKRELLGKRSQKLFGLWKKNLSKLL